MIPNPELSVLIVSYNTRDLLHKCLESIFDTAGDVGTEVFVADNNSSDGSAEMVEGEFPGVVVKRYAHNVGYTRAVNPLLSLARGKYYLLLHPDIEMLPGTLRAFIGFFESHPQAGILGGNLYYPDGTPNPCEILFPGFKNDLMCFGRRLFGRLPGATKLVGNGSPLEWRHESTQRVNWVWNACMIIRQQVLEEVGYFDERFFVWYADWDFCKRASDFGWWSYYLHSAKAIHYERQSFSDGSLTGENVRYKVDGWWSASRQIRDRQIFLRKHLSPVSVVGSKAIYVLENSLRLVPILGRLLSSKGRSGEPLVHLKACLETIQTIVKT